MRLEQYILCFDKDKFLRYDCCVPIRFNLVIGSFEEGRVQCIIRTISGYQSASRANSAISQEDIS